MPNTFDFGGINLTAGGDTSGARPTAETPFNIAILGDFSGRAGRAISDAKSIAQRRGVQIDRDNFDEVLSRLGPQVKLSMGEGSPIRLQFSELDDFHPDRLFEHREIFGKVRDLRVRLQNPSTFRQAAKDLGLDDGAVAAVSRNVDPVPAPAPSAQKLASGSLLDDLIEQTEAQHRSGVDRPSRAPDEVREFAQRAAEKYTQARPDGSQPQVLAVLDRAISGLMRAVLHNPDFQSLEAAWRATFLLVRQLDTSSRLKLHLFDISKAELAADIASDSDVRKTGIYRLMVEGSVGTPGAEPWAILLGNYAFDAGERDTEVLSGMARIARLARAPFIAGANPEVLGCSSLAAAPHSRDWRLSPEQTGGWRKVRTLPDAETIGLALPRFLLRLPYGKKTYSAESFDFEEFEGAPGHEDYLWGNSAFAVALRLGRAFNEAGWEMSSGISAEIDGLPLHIYDQDGETQCKPCAEVLLTEETVGRILNEGLIPLVSFKNRDLVRVAIFQSVADPPRPLAGRWTQHPPPE